MGDSNPLNIILDKNTGSYFPGDEVKGRVILDVTQGIKTDGVRLNFYGGAYVRWTTTRYTTDSQGKSEKDEDTHRDAETFTDQYLYLIRKQGNQQVQLSPGHHQEFPFSFQLPLGIPSSLENFYGHVRYSVTATIEKSGWNIDPICSIPVIVSGILDLNNYPEAQRPFQCEDSKYVGCLCCKDGPISFVLKLSKTGFVPGEPLNFVMEMNNQSKKVIPRVEIRLERQLQFHAWATLSKHQGDIVAVISGPGLGAHQTKSWHSDPRKYIIPPAPPTNLGGSARIIGLQYTLWAEMEIPGAFNLGGGTGILIGTIPFGKAR